MESKVSTARTYQWIIGILCGLLVTTTAGVAHWAKYDVEQLRDRIGANERLPLQTAVEVDSLKVPMAEFKMEVRTVLGELRAGQKETNSRLEEVRDAILKGGKP